MCAVILDSVRGSGVAHLLVCLVRRVWGVCSFSTRWFLACGCRAGEPCYVVQQVASDRLSFRRVWLVDVVKS